MADIHIDLDLLSRFEAGLDPRRPERGPVPARVLGHGEISTTLAIGGPTAAPLAYKRLALFHTTNEAAHYEALHRRYVRALGERAGVRVIPCTTTHVVDAARGRVVVYIVHEQISEDTIGNMAIYRMPAADVNRLVLTVLQEVAKVFAFNQNRQGDLELGFNAQIAHWAIVGFDPERGSLPERFRLLYMDTSTPLMRRRGQEQLNPDLFLRSAPSLLVPIVRRIFLPEVMTRYYNPRRVALDLIANFLKEGRPDLISGLVDTVNWFFLAELEDMHFKPITVEELQSYYRWDALIWRIYLGLRKLERTFSQLRRRYYPHILPVRGRL